MNFEYHAPSSMIYKKGARLHAGQYAKVLGINKVFVISDRFMEKTGVVKELVDALGKDGLVVNIFTDIDNEPTDLDVNNALKALHADDCDGIISIGGGSVLDTAKMVAVIATNGGIASDYMGLHKVKRAGLPHIAIPTTAGTGSEATRIVIITDTDRDIKMMCLDNFFMPSVAIIDYELTLTMPKNLTAYVGLDALTHAIEAYVSKKANPISDVLALLAIDLISKNILVAYEHPDDEIARENMMLGSNYAGLAFSNSSVCAIHGLSRPIGAYFHVAHGLSNAMLLPIVTENSIEGNPERYTDVAQAMGYSDASPQNVVDKLKEFNAELRIPNPKEWGIKEDEFNSVIEPMVDAAIQSGSPGNNPRVFTPEELAELYRQVYTYK